MESGICHKRFSGTVSATFRVVLVLNVDVFFIIYYCLSLAEGGNGERREAEGKVKAWGRGWRGRKVTEP